MRVLKPATTTQIDKIKMAGTSRDTSSESDNIELIDHANLFQAAPPDIAEIAKHAINDLLPTKSKERYELAYEKFNNYK